MAVAFIVNLGSLLPVAGFAVSFILIAVANAKILKEKTPQATIKVLPMFHLSMLIYAITIIANYAVATFL
jgi:4-hydroxybenzoate polyprenyltransferase